VPAPLNAVAEGVDYASVGDEMIGHIFFGPKLQEAAGGEVDALLDLVSFDPDSFGKLAKAVRRGGKATSTAGGATEEALEAAGLTGQVIMAMPNREILTKLIAEIERGVVAGRR
jgi:hypothetical protein